jgi:hypothetical protein
MCGRWCLGTIPSFIHSVLGATAFNDLSVREVVAALGVQIDMGTGLLGASTMSEGVTT